MTTIKQLYFSDYKQHLIEQGLNEDEAEKIAKNVCKVPRKANGDDI